MNMKRFSVLCAVVLLAALNGCSTGGTRNGSGSLEQTCKDFCQHAQDLNCPEGQPLANGASCETFCIDTEKAGHDLNLSCRIRAKSCTELSECP